MTAKLEIADRERLKNGGDEAIYDNGGVAVRLRFYSPYSTIFNILVLTSTKIDLHIPRFRYITSLPLGYI